MTTDLGGAWRGHSDRVSGEELGGADVYYGELWTVLREGVLDFRAPNSVAKDVEGWLLRGVEDEAGDGGHRRAIPTRPTLTVGAEEFDILSYQALGNGAAIRGTGHHKLLFVLQLAEER